jgi:hypothetical protein
VRRFCSAPASIAPSLHARGRLPCIRTCLCKGEGSSPCLATPWLLRVRYAQPSPSFRSFSFRLAMLHSHLRLREDRGLPVLGPCLPLPFPRRPLMSITRDPPAHQLGRGLSSSSGDTAMRCTPSSCTAISPPPVAGPAFASALPNSFRARPNRVRSWPASCLAYTARLLLARYHADPLLLACCHAASFAPAPPGLRAAHAFESALRTNTMRSHVPTPAPAPACSCSSALLRLCRAALHAPAPVLRQLPHTAASYSTRVPTSSASAPARASPEQPRHACARPAPSEPHPPPRRSPARLHDRLPRVCTARARAPHACAAQRPRRLGSSRLAPAPAAARMPSFRGPSPRPRASAHKPPRRPAPPGPERPPASARARPGPLRPALPAWTVLPRHPRARRAARAAPAKPQQRHRLHRLKPCQGKGAGG